MTILIPLPAFTDTAAPEVRVRPGGLVRWPGTEGAVTACQLQGRRWSPLAGDCWYPIDLLEKPGSLQLGRVRGNRMETTTVHVRDYPYSVQRLTVKDTSKVDLSAADLTRVHREAERIRRLWDLQTRREFTLPLGTPLSAMPQSARFGDRRFINGEPRSPHTGADYGVRAGTPVRAVADGVVALEGDFFFSGNSVFIDHGDGLISMSFHLSQIRVREGEKVHRGEVIGLSGATGRVTGPHLHFGVRWHGARVDPDLLFQARESIPAVPAS